MKPEGEKTEEPPEVFRQIQLKVKVSGNVNLKNLERAVDLVESKYCGATVMIQNGGVTLSNISEVVQTQ